MELARVSAIVKALPKIKTFLNSQKEKTFSVHTIAKLLDDNREAWGLKESVLKTKFINELLKQKILEEIELGVKELFSLSNASEYDVIHAINRNGYFSHYTAMHYQGFTLQIPKVFYLNVERHAPNREPNAFLSQSGIDSAFASDQRKSSTEYTWNNLRIVIIQGKYTNKLGVKTISNERGLFKITNAERTLIDAVIRPGYCGGVTEVLTAFESARGEIDPEKLYQYLIELDYSYPYHQSIGFYLERAAYPNDILNKFDSIKKEFDFYLTYNIRQKEYNDRWKIYYPKGL